MSLPLQAQRKAFNSLFAPLPMRLTIHSRILRWFNFCLNKYIHTHCHTFIHTLLAINSLLCVLYVHTRTRIHKFPYPLKCELSQLFSSAVHQLPIPIFRLAACSELFAMHKFLTLCLWNFALCHTTPSWFSIFVCIYHTHLHAYRNRLCLVWTIIRGVLHVRLLFLSF